MGNEIIKRREAKIEGGEKDTNQDPNFVKELLALHDKYMAVVNEQFAGNSLLQKALKEVKIYEKKIGLTIMRAVKYIKKILALAWTSPKLVCRGGYVRGTKCTVESIDFCSSCTQVRFRCLSSNTFKSKAGQLHVSFCCVSYCHSSRWLPEV